MDIFHPLDYIEFIRVLHFYVFGLLFILHDPIYHMR